MTRENLINRLKEIGVIVRRPVTLRSGETSDYYCDIKKAFGYPDIFNAIVNEIIKILPANTTVIASSGYGGLPFGSVIASRSEKNFTAVRDNKKNHGMQTKLDGYIPTGIDNVVIVDDVLTTGSSIRSTTLGLQEAGAKVSSAISIVRRSDVKFDFPYTYIFDLNELI